MHGIKSAFSSLSSSSKTSRQLGRTRSEPASAHASGTGTRLISTSTSRLDLAASGSSYPSSSASSEVGVPLSRTSTLTGVTSRSSIDTTGPAADAESATLADSKDASSSFSSLGSVLARSSEWATGKKARTRRRGVSNPEPACARPIDHVEQTPADELEVVSNGVDEPTYESCRIRRSARDSERRPVSIMRPSVYTLPSSNTASLPSSSNGSSSLGTSPATDNATISGLPATLPAPSSSLSIPLSSSVSAPPLTFEKTPPGATPGSHISALTKTQSQPGGGAGQRPSHTRAQSASAAMADGNRSMRIRFAPLPDPRLGELTSAHVGMVTAENWDPDSGVPPTVEWNGANMSEGESDDGNASGTGGAVRRVRSRGQSEDEAEDSEGKFGSRGRSSKMLSPFLKKVALPAGSSSLLSLSAPLARTLSPGRSPTSQPLDMPRRGSRGSVNEGLYRTTSGESASSLSSSAPRRASTTGYIPASQRTGSGRRAAVSKVKAPTIEEPAFVEWGSTSNIGAGGDSREEDDGMAWVRRRREERRKKAEEEEKRKREEEAAAASSMDAAHVGDTSVSTPAVNLTPPDEKDHAAVELVAGSPGETLHAPTMARVKSDAASVHSEAPTVRQKVVEPGANSDEEESDEEEEDAVDDAEKDEFDEDLDAEEIEQEERLKEQARLTTQGAGKEVFRDHEHRALTRRVESQSNSGSTLNVNQPKAIAA